MTATTSWAVFDGILLGLGLWSLVCLLPRLRSMRLIDRTAPYLVDVSEAARDHAQRRTADPLPVIGVLAAPVFAVLRWAIDATVGSSALLGQRLSQAGTPGIERYRSRQLIWAMGGLAAGAVGAVAGYTSGRLPLPVAAIVPLIGVAAGVALRDLILQYAARRRLRRIEEELPTVLEFLSLSLAAGEAITDAVHRVSTVANGELSAEFGVVVGEVATGIPFLTAMRGLDTRLGMPAFTRCVDQIGAAIERGTPVAAVLRSQAQDSRDDAKRRLLESAGKKEVAMLVPLVFLILPLSILIAIFPGVFVLRAGF